MSATVSKSTPFSQGFLVLALAVLTPSNPGLAQTATWELQATEMPQPRDELASCAIEHSIYLLGGQIEEGEPSLATNEAYDVASNSWTTLEEMPTARRNLAAVAVAGKCYAIGGEIDGSTNINAVEAYDPATGQWSVRQDLPTARHAAAAVAIGDVIYVVGGLRDDDYLDVLEAYDPAADEWSQLAPMPTGRAFGVAGVSHGKLFVMGGNTQFADPVTTVEIYDPESDSWSVGPPLPVPLFYAAASSVDEMIYVTGGITLVGASFESVADTFVYDGGAGEWKTAPSLTTARNRHVAATAMEGVYVIGGAQSTGFGAAHNVTGSVERLQIANPEVGIPINFGHSGGWFNASTAGQGIMIEVLPNTGQVFLTWFTYESAKAAKIGSPEHRWLSGLGTIEGNRVEIDLRITSGGLFDDPTEVDRTPPGTVGTASLEFASCSQASMTYDFEDPSVVKWAAAGKTSNSFPIQRLASPPQACFDLAENTKR